MLVLLPEMTSVPGPVLVNQPEVEPTSWLLVAEVRIVPEATLMAPPLGLNERVRPEPRVMEAVVASVPPKKVTSLPLLPGLAPRLALEEICRVPLFRMKPPEIS